jgi:hypothetical protein
MKHITLAAVLLTLPVAAFALDFQHGDDGYSDAARLSVSERAAVSVLTDVGAVSGNPDGSFAADRTLNRAEFTKIALLSMGIDVVSSDAASCFPDVPASAWFSRYVCRAKVDGSVEGNPDGLFHPERAVNYVEALKILVELADYDLPEPPANERWTWYRAYVLAAEEHGVELPGNVDAGTELTRGQMARLAAAFVAEAEGELDAYRDAERGDFTDPSSSSSSSSSVSSESSSSSVSTSSSSSSRSSSSSSALYPAKSSFLLTGERSPLVLGGTVTSDTETSVLRMVRIVLRRKVTSLDKAYLVDANGTVIAEMKLVTNNVEADRMWEAAVPESTYAFVANTPTKVGVMFDLFAKGSGGGSNQLVEIESFQIQTEGITSGNTKYLLPDSQVYPVHQTAFGRMIGAVSASPASGSVQAGAQRMIASLRLTSDTATGGVVSVQGLELTATLADVSLSNVRIGDATLGRLADCGIQRLEQMVITCDAMPEGFGTVSPAGLTVNVYADLSLTGANNGSLNLTFNDRGRIGDSGSLTWTDGASSFTWLEEGGTFGGTASWTVTK